MEARVVERARIELGCLERQRSWCVSTDPEFTAKAGDIVGLYLNPPQNALVLSVDEKPSIQALERKTGYVETDNGKIVRGFKSTYKRHLESICSPGSRDRRRSYADDGEEA